MINKIKFSILFLILILLSCKSESKPTREDDIDTSVYDMWNAFKASNPEFKNEDLPDSDFFHDNEVDANRLAKLGLIPSCMKARTRRFGRFHCFQIQYRKRHRIHASRFFSF